MKKLLLLLFISSVVHVAFSQEVLSPLKYNTALFNQKSLGGSRSVVENRDTLCIPFIDDFSGSLIVIDESLTDCGDTIEHIASAIYPSSLFWADSNAFVNKTYPALPPTYGVATLDGLNKYGKPYNEGSSFDKADELTSKPINLADPTDSVYLSFYVQPGGFGEFPNTEDSIILDFKDVDGNWVKQWYAVNTLGNDPQSFKLIMVPVEDSYFYNGFTFRFRNWAGVNGNNDHWNIDYVLLDDERTYNDTLFRDVAIVYTPERYLKNYRQMPWNQFKNHQSAELAFDHGVFMYNNFNAIINTSHQYSAVEKYSGDVVVAPTTPVSVNLNPASLAYNSYPSFEIPGGTTGFDNDSLTIRFNYNITPSGDINSRNDTIVHDQAFYNYFAYDDGTAERAYALVGTGAKLAIHFHANEPDTLKEVYIHWAYVDGNKGNLFFSLVVWDQIDTTLASADENIIFQNDFLTPKYVDSINGFYVYKLVDFLGNPTPVVVDGDFYVGWLQTQDEFLNVGFDVNNDFSDDVYFNVGGSWQQSSLNGAIMIRPRVGGDYSVYNPIVNNKPEIATIQVYPNPATSVLHIDTALQGNINYTIFDQSGRIVLNENTASRQLDIANLSSGFYILKVNDLQTGNVMMGKFIKE
ncbi:MAG: T9SS type A sorting domain-containing protein [Chitinophagales bacterium]